MKSAVADRERAAPFTTISGRVVDPLYTAEQLPGFDYARDLGDPGQFPYARGIHPTGYRGKIRRRLLAET
jgi:methylmalonyl-CoA mutase N-terminal domain/subunit